VVVINQLTKNSNFQSQNSIVFSVEIIFWVACIFFGFLCLIPTAFLPSVLFVWWDKAQHILAFFCLTILGTLAYQKFKGKVVIGLFFYGGLIEILQLFASWRSGQLTDWVADGIGILTGCTLMHRLIQQRPIALKL
jgi:hypothetical protein